MKRLLTYWLLHGIPTGFQYMRLAAINWMDLMWFPENQSLYTLFGSDDPTQECAVFFWDSLEDNTIALETLEYLKEVKKELDNGTIEAIPFDPDILDSLWSGE